MTISSFFTPVSEEVTDEVVAVDPFGNEYSLLRTVTTIVATRRGGAQDRYTVVRYMHKGEPVDQARELSINVAGHRVSLEIQPSFSD
ncbi:hypothetical protein [Singulisphaera sp. PoT]|uniref:hypothetical protein n=1 Tax=Singulisphaera sp. PoT TaxID=3411797 RepID=UPI003BF4D8C6